ncbi:MAG: stage 0 sporulation family protein [Armatimonadota bacterium]|nr:MAG: stage 0 sporulation family protein [Armatimonadota bacterium]
MPTVVGVTCRSAGQIYHFDPGGIELHEGDAVIAPTQRGLELGQVVAEARDIPEQEITQPLRAIKRKATEEDLQREEENREREHQAVEVCAQKIQQHGLPMKLIEAHYTFDRTRIVFYFSADGRVDFRRLVRDLAREFKTRVELHQVGVRDEARLFGGFGPCGRPLCCASFLSSLQPVAIRMAKEQNLALNPLKISGCCGRLMCCLNFEYECYKQAKAELPRVGSEIEIPKGRGKVAEVNVIKRTITLVLDDGTRVEVDPAECAPPEPEPEPKPRPEASSKPNAQGEARPRSRRRRPRRRRSRKPKGNQG